MVEMYGILPILAVLLPVTGPVLPSTLGFIHSTVLPCSSASTMSA